MPWSSNITSLRLETWQKASSNYPLRKTPGNSWTSKLLLQLCTAKKVRHTGTAHIPPLHLLTACFPRDVRAAGLSHPWGCSSPFLGRVVGGFAVQPQLRMIAAASASALPAPCTTAQHPHLPCCNGPCCAGKAIAPVQLRLVFVLQYCKHLAMSYSSSETDWLQVTCIKWRKFTRSCPQMISSLNSKETHFFLSTAGIWWLLELHSGWAAEQVFPSFASWVAYSIRAN